MRTTTQFQCRATLKLCNNSLQDALRAVGSLSSGLSGMRHFSSGALSGGPALSAGTHHHGSYGSLGTEGDVTQTSVNMDGMRRLQSGYGSGILGGSGQHGSGGSLSQFAPQGPFSTATPQMQGRNGGYSPQTLHHTRTHVASQLPTCACPLCSEYNKTHFSCCVDFK